MMSKFREFIIESLDKKQMTKLSGKKLERGNDYIYYKDGKFYFEDIDGEMMEIKNKGYLRDIAKEYPKYSISESNINKENWTKLK